MAPPLDPDDTLATAVVAEDTDEPELGADRGDIEGMDGADIPFAAAITEFPPIDA